ncbi:hypothetical protein BZM26_37000 [Paraburkholderia strydomiana]|nr:hypothetical protein BZM26_37000 [Paraburkholderia strydomiana]
MADRFFARFVLPWSSFLADDMHEFTQSVRLKAVLLPVRMVGNRARLMAKQIRPTIRLTPINRKADIPCEPPFGRRHPERPRRVDACLSHESPYLRRSSAVGMGLCAAHERPFAVAAQIVNNPGAASALPAALHVAIH